MTLYPRAVFVLLLLNAASCGGQASVGSPGSGQFWIKSGVPTSGSATGASCSLEAAFTTGASACATTTVGACTVNPCYVNPSTPSGSGLPNVGEVTLTGAAGASVAIEPQSDGSYTQLKVAGQVPWTSGGDSVVVQWAHFPGDANESGGTATVVTPPYVALAAGSAFADPTAALVRTQDLSFSWSSDTPPSTADQLSVYLASGSTQVGCNFSASSGFGVVPAEVLQRLDAGTGTFDVHSKRSVHEHVTGADGAAWVFTFNVDAYARASYGLATGSVTIQ